MINGYITKKVQSLITLSTYPTFHADQVRQTRLNSGGVAEGHPRFDKGGGLQYFFYFLRVKNNFF